MAEWTQQEMEELIKKMTEKAMTDAEFRKAVLKDATAVLEKLAGKPLPQGASLKCIERDPNYQTTFVLPDLADEEKLDDEALLQVAGGFSIALIVTLCAAAAGLGPYDIACGAEACLGAVMNVFACGAQACAGNSLCMSDVCGSKSSGGSTCQTVTCGSRTCGDYKYDREV